MNINAVVKELSVQENDLEMYITMKKFYLTTLSPKQTPLQTDSKTKIPKIQPYIHKSPKIPGKHQQKNTKKNRIFFLEKGLSQRSLTKHVFLQNLQDEKRKKVRNFLKKHHKTLSLESEKLN